MSYLVTFEPGREGRYGIDFPLSITLDDPYPTLSEAGRQAAISGVSADLDPDSIVKIGPADREPMSVTTLSELAAEYGVDDETESTGPCLCGTCIGYSATASNWDESAHSYWASKKEWSRRASS